MSIVHPSTWGTCSYLLSSGKKKGQRVYFHNESSLLCRVLARCRSLPKQICFGNCLNLLAWEKCPWGSKKLMAEVKWPKGKIYQKYMQFFIWFYNLSWKKIGWHDSVICQAYVKQDSSFVLVDSLSEIVINHCVLSTEKLKVRCRTISAKGIHTLSKMKTNLELYQIKPENNWKSHPVISPLWDWINYSYAMSDIHLSKNLLGISQVGFPVLSQTLWSRTSFFFFLGKIFLMFNLYMPCHNLR